MKEMLFNNNTQGANHMKKTLFVAALAAVLVFAFATSAMAIGPFLNDKAGSATGAFNSNFSGYLSWGYAKSALGAVGTPHGNYATNTNKCAVCHSVHRAAGDGAVLTAIPSSTNLNTGASSPSGHTKGCIFCHGDSATFTGKHVGTMADGTISPHSNCTRCHTESPHGTNVSNYPVLAARLLNTVADDQIAYDLANPANNGLTADMFDLSNAALEAQGLTLGTGYLCANCHNHGNSTNSLDLAFAVNIANGRPAIDNTGANPQTGHRVWATATAWNTGGAGGTYNAYYTGTIAYAAATGCNTCHDAKKADGNTAFPHNYVDAAGAYLTKGQAGASLVWLTTAADADDAHVVLGAQAGGTSAANLNANNKSLTMDGLCLKCHLSGDQTQGVGKTF